MAFELPRGRQGTDIERIEDGRNVRSQRISAGLTQRQFAALAGVSHQFVSQIERGERAISIPVDEALGLALRIEDDRRSAAREEPLAERALSIPAPRGCYRGR